LLGHNQAHSNGRDRDRRGHPAANLIYMKADVGVSTSQLGRAGRPALDETGRLVAAAIVGAAGIVVFVLWVRLLIGGERVAGAVEDLTPALAAMVAAASCALAARRAE